MKRFLSRLDAILENVGGPTSGKVDILHKSGKHIIADHVKKVRSPKGGRLVLMAGIGPPVAPSDGPYWRDVEEVLRNSWTYRLRDFYVPYRPTGMPTARDVRLIGSPTPGKPGQISSMKYEPMGRSLRIKKKFKHVLVIDMRNIISINGQAVQQPQDIQQQPSAGLEQPQALNEAQEQQTTTDYAKLGLPPGPSGSPVKYFFKTAQGSMYILTENGESRRIKSAHANTGGEDAGLHGWNQKCVFVPPEDQIKGNSMQFLRHNYDGHVMLSVLKPKILTFLMIKNNQWSPVLFKDAYPKSAKDPQFQNKSEEPMEFKYAKEPTMGFNVCEWKEKGNKIVSAYHFGSEVSEIKDINDVDPKILSGFMDNKTQTDTNAPQQQTNQQQPNTAQTTSQEDTLPQWLEKNFGIQTTDAEIKEFPAQNKIGIRNRRKDSPGYGSMTYYDKSKTNQYKDFINQLKTSFGSYAPAGG